MSLGALSNPNEVTFNVHVGTGRYYLPGAIPQGGMAKCSPIAPPSTVRGFLQALCQHGWTGQFNYGLAQSPQGISCNTRQRHVVSNQDKNPDASPRDSITGLNIRTVREEILYDLIYTIKVKGLAAHIVRAALKGDIEYKSLLYLGTSEDTVDWMEEITEINPNTRWICAGTTMSLIVRSERGYKTINPQYNTFDLLSDGTPYNFS